MGNRSQCQVLIDQLFSHYPDETREKWDKFADEKLSEINERNKIIPPDAYANKQVSQIFTSKFHQEMAVTLNPANFSFFSSPRGSHSKGTGLAREVRGHPKTT